MGETVVAFPETDRPVLRITAEEVKSITRLHEERAECQQTIVAATVAIDEATEKRRDASLRLRKLAPKIESAEKLIAAKFGIAGPFVLTPDGVVIPQTP